MRRTTAVILAVIVASGAAPGAAPSPTEALEKPVKVEWAGARLTEALADLAKQGALSFVLDPAIPEAVRETPVIYSGSDVPLRVALGQALRAGGLRYTIRDGAVLVGTPKRLAERIVYGPQADDLPEAEPMTRGEALEALSPVEAPDITDVRAQPWRRPEPARENPVTGLTDYPGPPIWIDSPDADSARFKYSNKPSYLKAEHLDGHYDSEHETLGRALEVIKGDRTQTLWLTPPDDEEDDDDEDDEEDDEE
jgi:hypothetical protein